MATPTLNAYIGDTTYALYDRAALGGGTVTFMGHDGLGMPDVYRRQETGPNQHGSTDLGYKLLPRVFTLLFYVEGSTLGTLVTAQRALIDIFKPTNGPILFKFAPGDGSNRGIYAHFSKNMSLPMRGRMGFARDMAIEFYAPDPILFDPSQQTATITVGAAVSGMVIPTQIPTSIGDGTDGSTGTLALTYTGGWEEYPIVRITGPITNPVLTNTTYDATTGLTVERKLPFDGYTIGAGVTYEIDLRQHKKTVVDSTGQRRINQLSEDNDLAEWRLEADPQGDGGVNNLTLTGTATSSATQVNILYYRRYPGV